MVALVGCSFEMEGEVDIGEQGQDVLNGSYEINDQHPWVVRLTQSGCHGVLIHPEWVLTAAHCYGGYPLNETFVAPPNQSDHQVRQARAPVVTWTLIHPDYERVGMGTPLNDLALVRLDHPFDITEDVQTVALPTNALSIGDVGEVATALEHADGIDVPDGYLSTYEASVESYRFSGDHFGAANEDGAVVRKGDSGSGFVAIGQLPSGEPRATVYGVSSYYESTWQPGDPAFFSSVYHHRDWIVNTLAAKGFDLQGNVSMVRTGAGSGGKMRLECQNQYMQTIWAEAPMDVAGVEISLDCAPSSVIESTCDLRGYAQTREIHRFTREYTFGSIIDLPHTDDYAYWWQYIPGGVAPQHYVCQVALRISDETMPPKPRPIHRSPGGADTRL